MKQKVEGLKIKKAVIYGDYVIPVHNIVYFGICKSPYINKDSGYVHEVYVKLLDGNNVILKEFRDSLFCGINKEKEAKDFLRKMFNIYNKLVEQTKSKE